MANIDFTGLMGDETASNSTNKYDFTGLMDKEPEKAAAPRTFSPAGIAQRTATAEVDIKKRGNVWSKISEDLASGNVGRTARGILGAAGAPLAQIEGVVANPALQAQAGNFNPLDLAKSAGRGLAGREQGQYGDVFRIGGAPGPVAATAGLGLSLSPLKVVQTLTKTMGGISKLTDKGLSRAGKLLTKGVTEAEIHAGGRLGQAFKKYDAIKIDGVKFLDEMTKLPKVLVNRMEDMLGNLDDVANNLTIGRIREVKRVIGKYKSGGFGKGEKGLPDTIDSDKINEIYSFLKNLMESNLLSNTSNKITTNLMKMEDTYSGVAKAANYIRSTVVSPKLQLPTRAGKLAEKIQAAPDLTARTALNTLKGSGGIAARNAITSAVDNLQAFNRWQNNLKLIEGIGRAGIYGGIGGYVGSKVIRKAFGDNEGSEQKGTT